MKKPLLLLCCILLLSATVRAQYVTIPDDNFRAFLKAKYPSCFNGADMMDTTCTEILNEDTLMIAGQPNSNGEGIQYFKSLKYLNCTGNNFTSLPPLPSSLQYLIFSDCNFLTSLGTLPISLLYLDCHRNHITTLPSLPPNLVYLDCHDCLLTSLPQLPSSLQYLDCQLNQLPGLPPLPASLKHLDCNSNYAIASIPSFPSSLEFINCASNGITSLPPLPSSLQFLYCGSNQIAILPSLPGTLQYLDCHNNQLTSLPDLSSSLQHLDCQDNQITSLPGLSSSLQFLNCSYNKLTGLPSLPASLAKLYFSSNKVSTVSSFPASLQTLQCGNNLLTGLPDFPEKLTEIVCSPNQIATLPVLPPFLRYLDCSSNQLANLGLLPASLKQLLCFNNKLTALPTTGDSLTVLNIYNNNIYCLPVIHTSMSLLEITLDSSKIRCLPNTILHSRISDGSGFDLSLPLCDATNNSHGCQGLPVIEGSVFYDYNINGIKDNNEVYRSGAIVSSSNGVYSFTNDTGFYQISADTTGTITLSITAPSYSIADPVSANFNFTSYDTTVVQNFAIQPDVIKDSLSITAVSNMPRARPGFNYSYLITYQNEGSTNLSPTIQFHFNDQLLTYDSSSNASVSHAGNTLTLNVSSLPYGGRGHFTAYFTVKTTAPIGDTVCAWVSALAKTAIAYNDACNVISGSFDPNDKQSTPILSPEQVNKGGYINYTIRFQNTGTDTAFTVVIADTLSNKLQANTLQMLCASHLCKTTVKDGIAYFEFLNIQLPDSNVNEQASHGFVQFRIKPQSNLTLNSQVENKSYIYFDYNKPVMTNTAITIIKDLPLPISLLSFTGSLQGNQTNLYWQTASEINFSRFEIERSTDGISYSKIGTALAKNTSGSGDYTFTDSRLTAHDSRLYYRLKIIDKDGSATYSAVVLVIFNKDKFSVLISPNPGKGKFSIQLFNWKSSNGSVRIADMNGRVVYQKESIGRNVSILPIDIQNLAKGMYMVTIEVEGQKIVQKVVVQ